MTCPCRRRRGSRSIIIIIIFAKSLVSLLVLERDFRFGRAVLFRFFDRGDSRNFKF